MTEEELKESIINAALEWREADENEPIPSEKVRQKLYYLVCLVDDLKDMRLFKNYPSSNG